jgi:hypothetical protein
MEVNPYESPQAEVRPPKQPWSQRSIVLLMAVIALKNWIDVYKDWQAGEQRFFHWFGAIVFTLVAILQWRQLPAMRKTSSADPPTNL